MLNAAKNNCGRNASINVSSVNESVSSNCNAQGLREQQNDKNQR
jgi:hypothetical protein